MCAGVAAVLIASSASADGVKERAQEYVESAEKTFAGGDMDAAERQIDLAWVYVESGVFGRRDWKLVERVDALVAKVAAVRHIPDVAAARDRARAALAQAQAARPPAREELAEARRLAAECVEQADRGARTMQGTELAPLIPMLALYGECTDMGPEIDAAALQAEEAWRARDTALRLVLTGERLEVYKELGEPDGALAGATPQAIAKAKTWEYVKGPTGKLKTFERWTIVFSGNRVVSRKRTVSHEE